MIDMKAAHARALLEGARHPRGFVPRAVRSYKLRTELLAEGWIERAEPGGTTPMGRPIQRYRITDVGRSAIGMDLVPALPIHHRVGKSAYVVLDDEALVWAGVNRQEALDAGVAHCVATKVYDAAVVHRMRGAEILERWERAIDGAYRRVR